MMLLRSEQWGLWPAFRHLHRYTTCSIMDGGAFVNDFCKECCHL